MKETVRVTTRMLPPACTIRSEACTLAFVPEGSCRLYDGSNSILLRERSCAILRPLNSYCLEGYCRLMLIQFSQERLVGSFLPVLSGSPLLSAFFLNDKASAPRFLAFPACDETICGLFTAFSREYLKERGGYEDIICCDLTGLLLRLARSYPAQNPVSTGADAERAAKAFDLLLRRYKTITLSELARELEVHPNTAAALLKRETGKTFSELVSEIRMDHAAALLSRGKNVREAAAAIGYTNLSCFYKHFTARFGQRPGAYRSMYSRDAGSSRREQE